SSARAGRSGRRKRSRQRYPRLFRHAHCLGCPGTYAADPGAAACTMASVAVERAAGVARGADWNPCMSFAPETSTVKNALSAHAAIGLLAGALLYLVSLSGTVLVFYDELRRIEQPGLEMAA